MREFNLNLSEAFTKGLRPRSYNRRNSFYLKECKYLKVTEEGLIEDEGVVNPFTIDPYNSWPFPQLIRGAGVTLLAGRTSLYEIDESNWTYSLMSVDDYKTPGILTSIAEGGSWHFADFHSVWMLFNGASTVFMDNSRGMFGEENLPLVCNDRTIQTGVGFAGRLFLGGFNPSDFWDIEWQSLVNYWATRAEYDVSYALSMGENFIWWSSIGGGNALDLFYPERAVYGILSEDSETAVSDPLFMEHMMRNDFGLMPMPWQGTVYRILPLGKGAMVYGENGIAFIYPANGGGVATIGLEKILDIGIASRSAAGGSSSQHIFVDTSGALWRIDANLQLTKLDYVEYISDLINSDIVITFNPYEREFYIGGLVDETEKGYLLTDQGLSQVPQAVTSGYFIEGAFVGVRKVASDTEVLVTLDVQDLGYREDKTITTVEIGLETSNNSSYNTVQIAADYRYSKDGDWRTTPWVVVNDKGWERLQITATEIMLHIKIDGYQSVKLDELNIRWQMSNKQTVRGFSAAKIN